MNQHRHTLEHKKNDNCTHVGHHFTQPDPSVENMNFLNTQERNSFELQMIILLDTRHN